MFTVYDPILNAMRSFPTWEAYCAWLEEFERDHPECCHWLKGEKS